MLTKKRFQEVDTPNLVLNLCSYREETLKNTIFANLLPMV